MTAAELAASATLSAGSGDDDDDGAPRSRVAVVGAGIAGLHCAYRLQ